MAHKKKGNLTTSSERAKHLRKYLKKQFWSGERNASKQHIQNELADTQQQIAFTFQILEQTNNSFRFKIKIDDEYLSFKEVFDLWQISEDFVLFYVEQMKQFNFKAIYWEHPAVTLDYLDMEYECIVLKSKTLEDKLIDEKAFENYIHTDELVTNFMNLGKNARLVVPTKQTDTPIYNHLCKFLNQGNEEQIIALFQSIGKCILEEVEQGKTIWLSTAGLGVIWLHVRMDTVPKYYKTKAFRNANYTILI